MMQSRERWKDLWASNNPMLEFIYVKTGHVFYGFNYDDYATIVYLD